MAIWDIPNLLNIGGSSSAKKNFLSPELNARADIYSPTTSKFSLSAPQTTTTTTDSRSSVYAPIDSRQLVLNINSAGATTKKEDRVSASAESRPVVDVRPIQDITARQDQTGSGIPSLLGGGISPVSLLIIGGVVLGGAFIFKGGKK